jgi:hypothetical protein
VKLSVYKGGTATIKLSPNVQVAASTQIGANFTYSPDGTLHLSVYSKTSGKLVMFGMHVVSWKSSVKIDVSKMLSSPEAFLTLSWLKVSFSFCLGGWCPSSGGWPQWATAAIAVPVALVAGWCLCSSKKKGKSSSSSDGIAMGSKK